MTAYRYDVLTLVALVAAYAHTAWVYPSLPQEIPIHWSYTGEVDRAVALPWGAWILPSVGVVVVAAVRVLAVIAKDEAVSRHLALSASAIAIVCMAVSILALENARGQPFEPVRFAWLAIGAMLIVVSNSLGKLPRNRFSGIRLPWTLRDDEAWRVSNRLAGVAGVITGVVLVAACIVVDELTVGGLIIVVAGFALAVTVGSWWLTHRRQNG